MNNEVYLLDKSITTGSSIAILWDLELLNSASSIFDLILQVYKFDKSIIRIFYCFAL